MVFVRYVMETEVKLHCQIMFKLCHVLYCKIAESSGATLSYLESLEYRTFQKYADYTKDLCLKIPLYCYCQ